MKTIIRLASPLLLAAAFPAFAMDLRVTTFADEYDGECSSTHCSLRDAISVANGLERSRIILSTGEYRLAHANLRDEENEIIDEDDNLVGDLDVMSTVTIVGKGIGQTILHGADLDRLIEVMPEGRLTLRDLTITGGRTPHRGAGLENRGATELLRVSIGGNSASSAFIHGQGGGIANSGSLLIKNSIISGNYAGGSESALGSGGGIYNTGALWMRDSRVGSNRCNDDNDSGEGCGLYNTSLAEISRSVFDGNENGPYGTGSAILNRGQLRLSNTTLSGNSAGEYGGAALDNGAAWGVDNRDVEAELMNVTIADNQGYGLVNRANLTLRNSVVAGNRKYDSDAPGNCQNLGAGANYSSRGLLLGNDGGNCVAEYGIDDATTFTRHLFPLAANNGTLVHTLRRTSAAIDAAVGSCSSHDQRGLDRPRDGNGDGLAVCDLGAFERAYP